jgi:hypothetical protein
MRAIPIVILLLSFAMSSRGQNFDKLGMVTVSGGMNYNGIFYASNGINNRRPPYSWFFNGNLNLSILDVSLPFTYSYSNLSSSYTQPFNMASCAPSYKWVKTYVGFTSMNFSNYTLAGHVFLGGGAELTPGHWKIAGMYGRLKKAVEFDAVDQSDETMSYRRMGYGAKMGYENNGYGLDLIYFSAKDDIASLKFTPSNTSILPQENTVVSVHAKTKVTKLFTLEGEYALSGLTRNLQSDPNPSAAQSNRLPLIFSPNSSSQFFEAYRSSLGFSKGVFSLGLNYEHIAPNYKTLGAYYFNNDLENFTFTPSLRLLNGKLNLGANAGYQHNNLDKSKFSTNKRFVTSATVSYAPSAKFSCNALYSNFSTYTNVRPITDPYYQRSAADTLNFYQVSQSANASMTYNIARVVTRHSFVLAGSYQVSSQKQGNTSQPGTLVINGNFCYNISFIKSKWSAALTCNYNHLESMAGTTLYAGPGITLGKSFAKNLLRLSISNVFNQAYTDQKVTALVLNERASLAFTPKLDKKFGKPSLSLSAMYTNKFRTELQKNAFSEFTGMVNLGYSF